jgi:hypothetical protein
MLTYRKKEYILIIFINSKSKKMKISLIGLLAFLLVVPSLTQYEEDESSYDG